MKTPDWNGLRQAELAFFGKMGASISHELKNQLAILNEEVGLMSDLILAAERGQPLSPSRLQDLVERIVRRVDAMDDIVKRLNLFAHSADVPVRTFDVNETLLLMVGLCQRFAAIKKVELTAVPASEQVQITGPPFGLASLLYLLIDRALQTAGEGGKVMVEVQEQPGSAAFLFTGTFRAPLAIAQNSPEYLDTILERLGASLSEGKDPFQLVLRLPRDLHRL